MLEENIEIFDKYESGLLEASLKKDFEVQLDRNLAFRKEYEEYLLLIQGIRAGSRQRLKKLLLETDADLPVFKPLDKKTIRYTVYKKIFAIAASILLLMGLFFIYTQFGKEKPSNLYAEYFEPYQTIQNSITRGFETEGSTISDKAFQAYRNKDYTKSIELFKSIQNFEDNSELIFYLGNACMANANTKQAIGYFEKISNVNGIIHDKVEWYLCLCYLKENNVNKAKAILEEISRTDNFYAAKSKEILSKL